MKAVLSVLSFAPRRQSPLSLLAAHLHSRSMAVLFIGLLWATFKIFGSLKSAPTKSKNARDTGRTE